MDSSKVRMQGIINDYLGLKAAVVLVFPTDLVVYKFPIGKGRATSDSISKKFVSSYGLQQFADSVRIDLDMSNVSVFDTDTFFTSCNSFSPVSVLYAHTLSPGLISSILLSPSSVIRTSPH